MGPNVDSIISDRALPSAVAVAIIGGGIIGISAALALAQRGVRVAVCEKGSVACEQSSRNWGWCRQTGRDEREMPLIIESLARWREMNRVTGGDTGFRECGVLYVGESEADEARFEQWRCMARSYQVDAQLLRGARLGALMPGATRSFTSALFVATDGCAEPQRAVPAMARAAQRLGAVILNRCAVRGVERSSGRISALITERGVMRCDAVILAGGAWSSLFCASLGIRLPQLKVLSSVMRTEAMIQGPSVCTYLDSVAYRKRQDGGYTIARGAGFVVPFVPDSLRYMREFTATLKKEFGSLRLRFNALSRREFLQPRSWRMDATSPFEVERVLDPPPNRQLNREAMAAMAQLYPQFSQVKVVQEWAGYIDVTPDVIPYIGAAGMPGLTIATGFSGHGFGIGPAAGHLAAQLAIGERPLSDPRAFRISRFADGSPITLGPEI